MDSIHDKFFKSFLQDKEVTQNLFMTYLPENISSYVSLESIKIQNSSFVGDDLKEYFSDILYTARIKGIDSYIYFLVEHKSYVDNFVSLQLLRYMQNIWELDRKQKSSGKLKPVIPVLIYHGEKEWNPKELEELFLDGIVFEEYIPNFSFIFFDIRNLEIGELGNNALRSFLLVAKYKQTILRLKERHVLNTLVYTHKFTILSYIVRVAEEKEKEEISDLISSYIIDGDDIMVSIAESWKREGEEKAKKTEKIEIAERLIRRGCDNDFIHDTTQMPLDEIQILRESSVV